MRTNRFAYPTHAIECDRSQHSSRPISMENQTRIPMFRPATNATHSLNRLAKSPSHVYLSMRIEIFVFASFSVYHVVLVHLRQTQLLPEKKNIEYNHQSRLQIYFVLTLGIIASILTSIYIKLGSCWLAVPSVAAAFIDVRNKFSCKLSANEFSHKMLSKWKLI